MSKEPIVSNIANQTEGGSLEGVQPVIIGMNRNENVHPPYKPKRDLPLRPCVLMCPKCKTAHNTTVVYENGLFTFAIAGGLCLIGCWMGCCLIPFFVEDCQDSHHSCSTCGLHLGSHQMLSIG